MRVNKIFTLEKLKEKIASKYETFTDNVILNINGKTHWDVEKEQNLLIYDDLNIKKGQIIQLDFK